jgi:hypothetical protein
MPVGDVRGLAWKGGCAGPSLGIGNVEPARAFPLEIIGELPWDVLVGRRLVPDGVVCVPTFKGVGF